MTQDLTQDLTDDLTVTLDDLPLLMERGAVPDRYYLKAVSFLRDRDFWIRWAVRALLAVAVGHILSGIIFFFAFNWNDLSGMTKFSIVGGGIFACLVAWTVSKLDSPVGQSFGIGATVLVGVMFAVLGQVYQTPAMIHTPFVFWAVLTLPFALASRNLAHWTVWLVILTVAISTYANSGLRLGGNDSGANLLNIVVGGGFFASLVVLDKIVSPHMGWARGEWFRVLLVLGASGFAFFGFTESFWDYDNWLWVLAFGLVCAQLAYLYFVKPSLATLSLASFALFTLLAQLGFKLFDTFDGGVGIFFLVFIWLGALTVCLVALFRHFIKRFKTNPDLSAATTDDTQTEFTKPANEFSGFLGLESDRVSRVLESDIEREQPWYMSVILAIAGILTALLGCAFFGALVGLILSDADEIVFGVLGSVIFALSIMMRRKTNSQYVQHILNTLIVVGGVLAAFGFGVKLDDFDAIVALLLFLSLIVLIVVKDRILEFLSAAAIITLIGMELYHLNTPMVESVILVLATLAGVICLSRPIRGYLYKGAGTAFLMAPAVLGIALVHAHRWDDMADATRFSDDWIPRLISLIVLIGAVIYLNRGKAVTDFNPPVAVLIPLLIGASLVPLGGASALLLMLTGYILGSRSLAIIGTLLQIYFLTMFYYDLSLGLLTKSIILFVSGLVFLGVWIFVRRHEEASA